MDFPRFQSEIFLRTDLLHMLRAIWRAHSSLARRGSGAEMQAYRQGFHDALLSVSEAVNVPFDSVMIETIAPDRPGTARRITGGR